MLRKLFYFSVGFGLLYGSIWAADALLSVWKIRYPGKPFGAFIGVGLISWGWAAVLFFRGDKR